MEFSVWTPGKAAALEGLLLRSKSVAKVFTAYTDGTHAFDDTTPVTEYFRAHEDKGVDDMGADHMRLLLFSLAAIGVHVNADDFEYRILAMLDRRIEVDKAAMAAAADRAWASKIQVVEAILVFVRTHAQGPGFNVSRLIEFALACVKNGRRAASWSQTRS